MSKRTAEERFWAKVQKTDGCWLWTASRKNGYGQFSFGGRNLYAHRYAYELLVGPIPKDRPELDHRTTCPKRCVNPAHLRPVTKKQNGENRAAAGRADRAGGTVTPDDPLGSYQPRTPPKQSERCYCCNIDAREEAGGNGNYCFICIGRGHHE